MDRRNFLLKGGALGCSLAASPFVTPITMAKTPGGLLSDNRLVVIILRGAMDGLDALRPLGDPDFAGHRRMDDQDRAYDLDGFFGLNPGLSSLMPLWSAGELSFAHAVATPYRDKRSHFDGQDILEAGISDQSQILQSRDGWLNRLLTLMPGVESETAFAVGREDMRILHGDVLVPSWSPNTRLTLSDHAERLLDVIYHDDPLFRDAARAADDILESLAAAQADVGERERIAALLDAIGHAGKRSNSRTRAALLLAEFAANRLREDTRIVSYSLGGWDTHSRQAPALKSKLVTLSASLLGLKHMLGPVWAKTSVLVMTEFGRTVRENGSSGTDHGTGGAMIMAGGAMRGGRVFGDWPGLSEADMYQRRDLMPTADVRSYAGHVMRGLYGLRSSEIERTIFPGLDMGRDPGLLL